MHHAHETTPQACSNSNNHASELVFLGTGAACANPIFFCGCAVCEEARTNPLEAKTCSSLAICGNETTLIDTAPELRLQLSRERITSIDRILFTHNHFDHTGGLPQVEFAIRLSERDALPVYGTQECLQWLAVHYDWMWDTIAPHVVKPFDQLEFDGITYTALPANHCDGALGYLLQKGEYRVAYFPDTGPLQPEVLDALQGIDVLIHDSTFIGRNWYPQTHTTVDGTIALARSLGAKEVYLAHCSMHFDQACTAAELQKTLAQSHTEDLHVVLPHDGLRIPLNG